MMNYEEFKNEIVNRFATYLPKKYEGSKVSIKVIPKINVEMEAINVECPMEVTAQPILYLQGLYGEYTRMRNLDKVMENAANIFDHYSNFVGNIAAGMMGEIDKDSIVINLISTEQNGHLLDYCPHHQELDMTVIYREVVFLEDGSFNGRILTDDDLKDLGMTEEELYPLALSNTEKLFPAEMTILDDEIYTISNQCGAHGAATMLYEGLLYSIADEWQDDIYVLPSSIHEIIVIAVTDQNADRLRDLVIGANLDLIKKPVVLTNNIYRYSREKDELSIACSESKGPVS